MTLALHQLASLLYFAGAGLGVLGLRRGRSSTLASWLLGAGAIAHAAAFAELHGQSPPVPLSSFPAALSLISWLVVVSYLGSLGIARVREVAAWVGGVAGALTAIAVFGLWYRIPEANPAAAQDEFWLHAHVLISAFGFSLLALASVAGFAYLAKERALKRKSPVRLALPSLESLDRLGHFTLATGFALLTLGVATGFAWVTGRNLSPWTSHSLGLMAAWGVYLLPVGLRLVRGQRGDQPARSVVLGFAVLLFSYVGIRLLGVGT